MTTLEMYRTRCEHLEKELAAIKKALLGTSSKLTFSKIDLQFNDLLIVEEIGNRDSFRLYYKSRMWRWNKALPSRRHGTLSVCNDSGIYTFVHNAENLNYCVEIIKKA